MGARTVSQVIYRLANETVGVKKHDKYLPVLAGDVSVDPYAIYGSFGWCPDLKKILTKPKKGLDYHSCISKLSLQGHKITEIDQGLLGFNCLAELSLTGNLLSLVQNLPVSLQSLNLDGNLLNKVQIPSSAAPQLVNLGLSFNNITRLDDCFRGFENLVALDISNNGLIDLKNTAQALTHLTALKTLNLLGNPICLLRSYEYDIVDAARGLLYFDDYHINHFTGREQVKQYSSDVSLKIKIIDVAQFQAPDMTTLAETPAEEKKEEYEYAYSVTVKLWGENESLFTSSDAIVSISEPNRLNFDYSQVVSFPMTETLKTQVQNGLECTINRVKYLKEAGVPAPAGNPKKAEKLNKNPKELAARPKTLVSSLPIFSVMCPLGFLVQGTTEMSMAVKDKAGQLHLDISLNPSLQSTAVQSTTRLY